jgi:hypothetical protein
LARGGRTQRPNLSGDVLELADALGYGMGCSLSIRAPLHVATGQLAYRRAPPSVLWLASGPRLLQLRGTYGHGAADAQRLPHEQLRAGPHEHLLGGAHHHHARRLHGQDPGRFEHGGGLSSEGGGVESCRAS